MRREIVIDDDEVALLQANGDRVGPHGATHGRDTHEDDRFDANPKAKTYESEFMGGEHDLEEQEAAVAEEDLVQNSPGLHARVTLSVARDILRRDKEIATAKKPGRHRDSDKQMKAFADRFGDRLPAALPALLTEERFERPQLLGASATVALAHQQAVRSAMRKKQQDLQTNEHDARDEKSLQAADFQPAMDELLQARRSAHGKRPPSVSEGKSVLLRVHTRCILR